jgi:hypothetical protein
MKLQLDFAPLCESFFTKRLIAQRKARPAALLDSKNTEKPVSRSMSLCSSVRRFRAATRVHKKIAKCSHWRHKSILESLILARRTAAKCMLLRLYNTTSISGMVAMPPLLLALSQKGRCFGD